ncbi:MAG: class I SAM-dependent methyltransferase [Anaerolineae bacterium]|jgi:SAM-dependent methyltransferase
MYDGFSADYDRFVDWEARLGAEMPFIERQVQAAQAHRILDAACGTGMHAIELAQGGYEVVGVDVSQGMIEEARANAARAGLDLRFEVVGFGELAKTLTPALSLSGRGSPFDAVLCLGNSLPHVLTPGDLRATLHDFAACLRPQGLLLIQNRNFDAVLAHQQRWMDPQSYQEDGEEWVFVRFYDYLPDGRLAFNLATLQRRDTGDWQQDVRSTHLWPQKQAELTSALEAEGYGSIVHFGDMQGTPFDADDSPNLIVTARCAAARCPDAPFPLGRALAQATS